MKFVALALALLLAVGSQAASLQADSPSHLDHFRAGLDVYMNEAKDFAKKTLQHLDDAEYHELKQSLSQHVDNLYTHIKTLQGSVSPITDSVVGTISDATADLRASISSDIETLKTELEPKRAKLREVINEHIEEYRSHLEPIIKEYYAKHTADMEALQTKLDPIIKELHAKVTVNVEETKSALLPILEAIRTKIHERLESLKVMLAPYVDEYKDQVKQAYSNAQTVQGDEITALREKIAPLAEDIKVKLTEIFEAISATFNKS